MRNIAALIDYLDTRLTMPFVWGRSANDCVSFGIGAIVAQTGRDPLPADFGDWADEREAVRLLTAKGGMAAAVAGVLRPIAPALAMRGDIAGIADPRLGLALMVIEGGSLVGPGTAGSERLPRSAMTMAWSAVGDE